jgi:hypothetical protein
MMIPITFCASLPPCPILKAAEDTNCSFLNQEFGPVGIQGIEENCKRSHDKQYGSQQNPFKIL